MKRFASIYTLTTALLFSANTFAASNINVSLSLLTTCSITSINDIAFGSKSLSSEATATGSFNLTCSSPTNNISVQFGDGLNGDAITGVRRLIRTGSSTDFISYSLYSDSGRATPITTTAIVLPGPINSTETMFSIYGVIPINQQAPIGTYTDTITVLISY